MEKIQVFIELLKLEAKKSKAVSELTKKESSINNSFSEASGIRSNTILECVEWAELLLNNEAKKSA